jgi:hypothetical protein
MKIFGGKINLITRNVLLGMVVVRERHDKLVPTIEILLFKNVKEENV